MNSEKIKNIVRNFFQSDIPEEVRLKFYKWFTNETFQEEKQDVLLEMWNNSVTPADKSTLKDLKKVQQIIWKKPHHKLTLKEKFLRVAAIIILPLIGSFITLWLNQQSGIPDEINFLQCYSPLGEERAVILPDGSTAILRSGTLLIYPETFNGKARDIYLSGNGHFTVNSDPERPFTVKTHHLGVTALGTVFTIDAYPHSNTTTTTLESGKIRVHTLHGNSLDEILLPDEQIIYNNTANTYDKLNVTVKELTSETHSSLTFQSESFDNIIKALESHYKVKINHVKGLYANSTITIRFSENETLKQSLDILSQMIPGMSYTINGKEITIRNK